MRLISLLTELRELFFEGYYSRPLLSDVAQEIHHLNEGDHRISLLPPSEQALVRQAFNEKREVSKQSFAYWRSGSRLDGDRLKRLIPSYLRTLSRVWYAIQEHMDAEPYEQLRDDVQDSAQNVLDLIEEGSYQRVESNTDAFVFNSHALISLLIHSVDPNSRY